MNTQKEGAPPSTALVTTTADPAFHQLMIQHRKGDCLDELGKALREVTKAVQLTGKKGVLTLKINIQPATGFKGAIAVGDDIKVTLPKLDKGGSLFFANEDGGLQRDDPDQRHLDLKVVSGGPADGKLELRKIN